jgi:hypothetical protein
LFWDGAVVATSLPAELRAAAEGLYTLEAATGLIVARAPGSDATISPARFIHYGTGTAAIDWKAAISAMDADELPSSAGEKQMLQLAGGRGQFPS